MTYVYWLNPALFKLMGGKSLHTEDCERGTLTAEIHWYSFCVWTEQPTASDSVAIFFQSKVNAKTLRHQHASSLKEFTKRTGGLAVQNNILLFHFSKQKSSHKERQQDNSKWIIFQWNICGGCVWGSFMYLQSISVRLITSVNGFLVPLA